MYHADINKKFDSRYLHRNRFDWQLAEERRTPDSYQGKIFSALRKLETLRAEYDVFTAKAEFYPIETGHHSVLGICREYGKQKLLALFNFSEYEQMVFFENHQNYTDLSDNTRHIRKSIPLKPYGFLWALMNLPS